MRRDRNGRGVQIAIEELERLIWNLWDPAGAPAAFSSGGRPPRNVGELRRADDASRRAALRLFGTALDHLRRSS